VGVGHDFKEVVAPLTPVMHYQFEELVSLIPLCSISTTGMT
jgi:hypothetical protein